jgi:hypothetical protein
VSATDHLAYFFVEGRNSRFLKQLSSIEASVARHRSPPIRLVRDDRWRRIAPENQMSIKGYIYTMFKGADPGEGFELTDPIFGKIPTMGACRPDIRRVVEAGDQIFVVSGRRGGVQQYVVGGFAVGRKVTQLAAYAQFPENRQRRDDDGTMHGNVIVLPDGRQNPVDYHTNFKNRVDNYIIGQDPIVLETPDEIRRARQESLDTLKHIFKRDGDTIFKIIGRGRRLSGEQVEQMRRWLSGIKNAS